jgi:NAD(P)-dependent dehydrogenase (short-subunit alcohol dehydrogenase family)
MTTPASAPASPAAPVSPALDGKVAVITGGTRGIGRAVAEAYLAGGARVVVNGRDEQTGQAMLASLDAGGALEFRPGDITSRPAVDDLIDFTAEHFGRLDVVVLNAGGVEQPAPIAEMTDEEWDLDLAWNLSHAFWGMRRALAYQIPQRSGRIICMSSKQGKIGRPGLAGYVAAKHGLSGLVKSAALETGPLGITVNAVCPGHVLTDIIREQGPASALKMGLKSFDELIAMHTGESAVKRAITVEEVAALCLFLASDASSGITGAMLSVDGGTSPY